MKPNAQTSPHRAAWNKGKLVGQKTPLKLKEIWAIRIRLQLTEKVRDLALFNLAIDSKLRGCDLLSLKVSDMAQGRSIMHRAIVMQRKTHRPVQFEVTDITRQALLAWIDHAKLARNAFLFPSRVRTRRICQRDSTRVSSGDGWPRLDLMSWRMAHIRCTERKRR